MKLNSKGKGNSFERDISKKLSLWISSGKRKDLMYRTHSSGGRYTQNKKMGNTIYCQAGDITSTHPDSKWFVENFIIETKAYKSYDFTSILKNNDSDILKNWWNKLSEECVFENKNELLIMKFNDKPILAAINENIYNKLKNLIKNYIKINFEKSCLYIFKFDDLTSIDYCLFKNLIIGSFNNAV